MAKLREVLFEHDPGHLRIVGDKKALSKLTWKMAAMFIFGFSGMILASIQPWIGLPVAAVGVAFLISVQFDPAYRKMAAAARIKRQK